MARETARTLVSGTSRGSGRVPNYVNMDKRTKAYKEAKSKYEKERVARVERAAEGENVG